MKVPVRENLGGPGETCGPTRLLSQASMCNTSVSASLFGLHSVDLH
jgi:hypothetical protein